MFDTSYTLAQLETFLAVIDHGSFSGAARVLEKGQSAVSHSIANLESHLGVALFDRSGRLPVLTQAGAALVPEAREVVLSASKLHTSARSWREGEEALELSLVVDMIFPLDPLVGLIGGLQKRFSGLSLTVHTEARGAVTARLLDESCQLGVTCLLLPTVPPEIETIAFGVLPFVTVASPFHPVGQCSSPVPLDTLRRYTQLVLEDRSNLTADHQVGVVGSNNWKISSLGAKHRFLLEGFGWGAMPWHRVARDVEEGRLVAFQPASWSSIRRELALHIIYRGDRPLSPVAEAAIVSLREMKLGVRALPT